MSQRIVRILAFDPGSTLCGYCVLDYNLSNGTTTIFKSGTITGKSLIKQQPKMQAHFEKRYIVLWELEKLVESLIKEYTPNYVVSESAFAHRFIQAFASLTLVIQSIRTATMKAMGRDIHLIAPRESKKAVSASGGADKALVQSSIFNNPNVIFPVVKNNIPVEMTEHAYDSIAAGLAFIQNYLPSILACENIEK
jgi:Holliday junction resolvasome RuvABC endonuclease subunit